jgi:hypothetical protein
MTSQIWVDVNLALESTDPTSLRDGAWVNVIGYTLANPSTNHARSRKRTRVDNQATELQAILVWDAGSIRVEEYEKMLQAQRALQQNIN